ncbi:hypothetical protein RQP46_008047 [Phenoliferia psychrophenolica]
MLSLIRNKPLSLKLELPSKLLWLYPDAKGSSTDDEGTVLRGLVKISSPTTRAAKALVITFEGITYLNGAPGGWDREKVCTIRRELVLPFGDGILRAGNHGFEFSFVIPSTTAVSNTAVTLAQSRHYVLAPTVETRASVFLVALPDEPGSIPDPYQKTHDHISADLGPVRVNFFSPHLTQSSLLHLRVLIAGPPTPVQIQSIRVFLKPTYEVEYSDRTRPQLPPLMHDLQYIDLDRPHRPNFINRRFESVEAGTTWCLDGIYRVPDCQMVWPSTFDSSDARMKVKHTLGVEMLYKPERSGAKIKSLRMEFPVTVFSVSSPPGPL